MRILRFRGFQVPGLSDVEIVVPKVEDKGALDIDLVTLGIPGLDVSVPYLEGTPGPAPENWLGFKERKDFKTIPLTDMNGFRTIRLGELISNTVSVYLGFAGGRLHIEVQSGSQSVFVPLVGQWLLKPQQFARKSDF